MPIEVAPIASPNPNQRFMAAVMANARRPEPLAELVDRPSFAQTLVDASRVNSITLGFLTDFVPYHLGQKDLPAEIDPAFDPYKQYGNPEWLNANPHMLDAFLDGDVADIPNQQRFDWFAARMKQDYDIRQRLAAAGTTRNILATIPGQIIDGMVGGLALRGLGLAGKAAQAGEWLKAGGTAAKFGKSAMLGASLNLAQEEALRALNPSRHVDEGQAALWAVGLGAAFGSGAHFIASGKTRLGKWMDPIRAKILSQQIASELSDPKFHGLDDVAAADEAMLRNEVKVAKPAETPVLPKAPETIAADRRASLKKPADPAPEKKPWEMTPQEHADYVVNAEGLRPEDVVGFTGTGVPKVKAGSPSARTVGTSRQSMKDGFAALARINATLFDEYNRKSPHKLKLPDGYVRDGEYYVYRGDSNNPAPSDADVLRAELKRAQETPNGKAQGQEEGLLSSNGRSAETSTSADATVRSAQTEVPRSIGKYAGQQGSGYRFLLVDGSIVEANPITAPQKIVQSSDYMAFDRSVVSGSVIRAIYDGEGNLVHSIQSSPLPPGRSVGAATPAETGVREGEIKRFTVLRTPITKQLMKEVEAYYKGGVEWSEHPEQWAYDAKKALEALDAEAKKFAPADLGKVQNAVVKTLGYVTPANKLAGKDSNPSAFSRLVARTLFDFTLPTQEGWDNPLTNTVNTPAEGLRMVYNGWAAESRLAYDEAFREAWQGKATARLSDGSDVTIGRGSKHEFSRAVQERIFAMHEEGRGQRAPSVVHPAIQKAADTLNEYYRKIGFEGKASGYLNYTTNPALPHFTQQWLTDVVERNKSDFIARLKTQWEKNRRIDYDTGTPIDPETWTTDNKVVNPEKISKGANAGGLTKADREAINAYAINNEMSVNEVTLANLRDEFGQDLLDRYEQELQIYYQKAAESTYDSLTHIDNGHGVLDAMDSIPADVREGRILKIDPTQFADYLERDAIRLLESYDHMVSGRISTRMAIKRDVKNIDKWYKPLMGRSIAADDYNPQMLIEAINEDFKAKIADERITTDLKDRYQHARDMLIGEKNGLLTSKLAELERRESGRPVGWKLFAERNIIRMPFLAQMGKMLFAAIGDLSGAAFVKRLTPSQVGTVRSILKPFVGAPRRDIQGAYVAVVDMIRGLRGDDLVDFSPNIERSRFGGGTSGTIMSAVDTGMGWLQKKFVQATLINRWSQGMRRFTAGGVMQDIIAGAKKMHEASILVGRGMKQEEAFAKVGLDIADARRLNRLGINSSRATRLLEKIDQHGVDFDGNRVDNTHDGFISPEMNKWWAEDRDLYDSLINAVNSETLNLVIEPKILSRPLMNNTLLGKLFNQFQGFAMAWGTQLAPLAMQRGGHEIAMYAGLMVGLGAIADALRNELTGRRKIGDTIEMWKKSPAGMVYAAVDRSGMTGWLSRPLGLLEQTPFGIAKNLKNTGLSTQYGRQGPLIDQLGPVFGWSNKLYSGVMSGMYEGGWDRKAKMMLWRATPFNNLWAIEGFNRAAERMGYDTPLGPTQTYQGAGR